MSETRDPTEKEKRIINGLALRKYRMTQMRYIVEGRGSLPEFRFPYPEADIDEEPSEGSRKSHHDLLIESLGGRCQVCGSVKDLEAHHIIPLEKGGPDNAQNLTVLCRDCHVKTF